MKKKAKKLTKFVIKPYPKPYLRLMRKMMRERNKKSELTIEYQKIKGTKVGRPNPEYLMIQGNATRKFKKRKSGLD